MSVIEWELIKIFQIIYANMQNPKPIIKIFLRLNIWKGKKSAKWTPLVWIRDWEYLHKKQIIHTETGCAHKIKIDEKFYPSN